MLNAMNSGASSVVTYNSEQCNAVEARKCVNTSSGIHTSNYYVHRMIYPQP